VNDAIVGLRKAVEADPSNHAVRVLLAQMLDTAGHGAEAFEHWSVLADAGALAGDQWLVVGHRALDAQQLGLAERCLQGARRSGVVDGVAELQRAFEAARSASDVVALAAVDAPTPEAPRLRAEASTVTFAQVGGLQAVKKVIHRKIVLPLQRPGLLARYRKKAGGGVLLYGPPGCGKTLLARATAGECGLPFFVLRIDDVLSKWLGESEQRLHAAFEYARASAPCVLFVDELDAIGFSRSKMSNSSTRTLVDQLLQELDSIGSDNEGVLVLAATNAPWDIDDALQRPGRFDRRIFVPPPDADARAAILRLHLGDRPVDGGLDLVAIAERTERFSGADLEALVEQVYDLVIEEALDSGTEPPARLAHFDEVLDDLRPSTSDWLERARTFVEFANHDDRYAEVAAYLRGRKKRWRLF
jgi:SpoVK/Ycf46/Vps4 family AAA+-type ATPase